MPTLQFKGKSYVSNHHLAVKYHQLLPNEAASLTSKVSLNDNLVIHGDNLLALKALLPNYAGRVKCIYIDPPYNTGNEGWRYNDNVNSPMMQDWLRGNQPVDREDLTRHDKWLCMMMPRLNLLRELLRDDGVIFISIDDNEVHHLRMLMDEVFGEQNFVTTIIWQKNFSTKNSAQFFSESHDYILVYTKAIAEWRPILLERGEAQDERYKNPDNDERGLWTSGDLSARNYYSLGIYSITTPSGRVIPGPPPGTYWRHSEEKFKELDIDNRIWWGEGGNNVPRLKRFLSEVKAGIVPQTIWLHQDVGHTQEAKKEIVELLREEELVFNTPKPTRLIKQILKIATADDDIVLDSFAGSGTTGQAVLQCNLEDGGNRRFILIETEDYADTLTAERIRRVIGGVPGAKDEKLREGLGGSFSYFTLGESLDIEGVLSGEHLPSYTDLARYLFYTATGEEFQPEAVNEETHFIGESKQYRVYLLYKPDREYLMSTSLTLEAVKSLPDDNTKTRLVFAPARFVDADYLDAYRVKFVQLPFELFRAHR